MDEHIGTHQCQVSAVLRCTTIACGMTIYPYKSRPQALPLCVHTQVVTFNHSKNEVQRSQLAIDNNYMRSEITALI